jgi:hypothetical protein
MRDCIAEEPVKVRDFVLKELPTLHHRQYYRTALRVGESTSRRPEDQTLYTRLPRNGSHPLLASYYATQVLLLQCDRAAQRIWPVWVLAVLGYATVSIPGVRI